MAVQVDRMALADLGNPTAIAEAVLKQLGSVAPPIPITEIALGSGISDIQALDTTAFEGALIAPDTKQTGVILVREASRHERRRFTVGHELGHFLNPWHRPPEGGFKCTAQDMRTDAEKNAAPRPKMEAEANEFSAAILLPKAMFCADLKKMSEPGLEHVQQLAKRYETSLIATARRFIKLHGDAKAVVVSKDGIVEQCYREHGFPFVALNFGQAVHRKSATATFGGVQDECSNVDAVEPALWLAEPLDGKELFEEVLVQGNGYRVTLLSVETSEDEDTEYARERSAWNPVIR